jgi:hypothetical protein
MAQVNHSSWDKTTREHKQNCASYIVNLLNESLVVENTDLNLIKSKIDEVNNSDVGNYSTLFYNEETKIVESVDILPEVIITPNGE